MQPMLNIAVRAARAAGTLITRAFESQGDFNTEQKGSNDYVTQIDKDAEALIISKIQHAFPTHTFISEESGTIKGDDEFQWIIDPLDGTTNFIKGIPHFAISIALLHKGRLDQAVVFDPMRGELFTASRGAGAQLNGFRIRCNQHRDLSNTVLATAFPFKAKADTAASVDSFARIFQRCGDVRRSGSAALDMAYVAAGRFDGYWEKGIQAWDIAAGELLVREAGGLVTDYKGGNDPMNKGNIVCGSAKVVQNLVRELKD